LFATAVTIISTRVATGIYPASLVSPTGTKFGCVTQKVRIKMERPENMWPKFGQTFSKRAKIKGRTFIFFSCMKQELDL
jgi:hypothetical protein